MGYIPHKPNKLINWYPPTGQPSTIMSAHFLDVANWAFHEDLIEEYDIFNDIYYNKSFYDFLSMVYPYEIKTIVLCSADSTTKLNTGRYTQKTRTNIKTYFWIMKEFHTMWELIYG